MFMVRYTPQKMLQNIMAVAANGCTELALYNGDDYDGLYLRKITQALEMIEAIKELKHGVDIKFESALKWSMDKDAEISALRARADKAEADAAQLKAALCSKFPDLTLCVSNPD